MSKLSEITVTKSGFVVPEAWLTMDGQPAPGVYVVVPKAKLEREALAEAMYDASNEKWPMTAPKFANADEDSVRYRYLTRADAILAHLEAE